MAKGTTITPADGLTQKQRRHRAATIVNTGEGKGKTTAAFGLALRGWNQGWSIGVFQFVKSEKWRVGEQSALEALGRLHTETGVGGPVEWYKMGSGWSWSRTGEGEAAATLAATGWAEVERRLKAETHDLYILDEFTYPCSRGWVDLAQVVTALKTRPGTQHVVITGRGAPIELLEIATTVTEMRKVKHPFDFGQRGQKGIEW